MLEQRYEWFPCNSISNAVECEKAGQLCPPGGDNKVNNQDLENKTATFPSSMLNEKT